MNRCALVGTHHKTGTAWLGYAFPEICSALGIRYVSLTGVEVGDIDLSPPVVLFDGHSFARKRLRYLLKLPDYRMLHLIRDPRDVVISGMHYHRVAREEWLHRPQDKFGGQTYQSAINSLPSDRERYLFEMDYAAGKTIRMMGKWDYGQPQVFECRYEDLISDPEMRQFTKAVEHLGFSGSEVEVCRAHFWRTSIHGEYRKDPGVHIRSGEPRQWETTFDRKLGKAFLSRFGDVLVRLGYEPDNSWVKRLPKAVRPAAAEVEPVNG